MSKIELTEAQTEKLRRVWLVETTHATALVAVANELVAMGLVRPASDDPMQREWEDVKARVAALEAKENGSLAHGWSKADPTPDPHAAAKDRAKLWGVELVTLKDGTCLFMTEKHYLSNPNPSWFPHVFSFRSPHYSGGHKTPSEAWSNFPTEPPPGWEAPKGEFQKALDRVDARAEKIVADIPPSQRAIISQTKAKPRTDADRLEMLAKVAYEKMKHEGPGVKPEWHPGGNSFKQDEAREIALAVRKADRAAQLEPSEEEWNAANDAYQKRGSINDALIAAARVRLEKAEGEAQ